MGIVDVTGSFHAGDAVEVAEGDRPIGKGICNYSSDELRRIKGMERPRCASSSRVPRTRPCTGTTSCWRSGHAATLEGAHGHHHPFRRRHLRRRQAASRQLATLGSGVKDAALNAIADALEARTDEILEANARDMAAGEDNGLDAALLDRLRLDAGRVAGMADGVRQIVALPDPVGEVIDGFRLANGLDVRKVRVPLGVVAVVYEARPNVTIDAAALALKSGNAIVLRGSSSAAHSNAVLAGIASEAATAAGLPEGALSLVAGGGREELAELATQEKTVDLIIPRGGEGLKAALSAVATVPVIYAASGNCHVFVDASADLDDAPRRSS